MPKRSTKGNPVLLEVIDRRLVWVGDGLAVTYWDNPDFTGRSPDAASSPFSTRSVWSETNEDSQTEALTLL